MNKSLLFALASLISTSSFAFQELTVTNKSNAYATGRAGYSPCSSFAGEKGVLQPLGTMTIPQMALDLYCKPNCNVDIYISKSCSGKSIATAHVDYNNGVTSVSNHNAGAYHIAGTGHNMYLEAGAKKSLFDLIFGAF